MTKINVSVLFTGELDNDHYENMSSDEKKYLGTTEEEYFY
jgi:hypothetical protein